MPIVRLPKKRSLASPYAAGMASASVMSMTAAPVIRLTFIHVVNGVFRR